MMQKVLFQKNRRTVLASVLICLLSLTVAATMSHAEQNWVKQGLVLDLGAPGDFDDYRLSDPTVIKDGATYKMWYSAQGNGQSTYRIGYATSSDGINWTKQGMVLDIGAPGEFDSLHVIDVSVIKDGATYKMWYTGGADTGGYRVGYATSSDGINWTKQGMVLDVGASGEFDEKGIRHPTVIFDGGTYMMWYVGAVPSGFTSFGYATSLDGINWTKHGIVLEVGAPGEFDDGFIYGLSVILEGTTYKMWYEGVDSTYANYNIGYATSPDGVNWTKDGVVLSTGAVGDFDEKAVQLPHVMLDGTNYKMWYVGATPGASIFRIGYATYTPPPSTAIDLVPSTTPSVGETFTIDLNISSVTDLFSAGFHLSYDPAVLQYISTSEGQFLNESGTVSTSLMAELLNGVPGTLVFGATRYGTPNGVSGSGTLATLTFQVISTPPAATTPLTFANNFLEDPTGLEITATWQDISVGTTLDPAADVTVVAGSSNGELDLSWTAVPGAVSYNIYRSDVGGDINNGTWQLIDNVTGTSYTDPNCIPTLPYHYRIVGVDSLGNEGNYSDEVTQTAAGLLGDINLDNIVDGRDLAILARTWGLTSADGTWDWRTDLNRDKLIDGEDLITLGTNFGTSM